MLEFLKQSITTGSYQKIWKLHLKQIPQVLKLSDSKSTKLLGINRVSLGIQSLNDTDLKKLGRLHSVNEAIHAIEIARINFENVSIDLIYARQDQSIADWQDELDSALKFETNHLSL